MTTTSAPAPTSYFPPDHLATALNLCPIQPCPSPGPCSQQFGSTPHSSAQPPPQPQPQLRARRSSRSRSRVRGNQRVSFCPTVVQYWCAPDGERDDAVVHGHLAGHSARPALPRLAVKTFSIEGVSLGAAWHKVAHSLAASLQASLSPSGYSGYPGGGVCQVARRHEEEGGGVWNSRTARQHEEDLALAAGDKKGRIRIKLPGLTRRRSNRTGSCPAIGILKRNCSLGDDQHSTPHDDGDDDDDDDNTLPELSRSPSSPPLSELSSSPTELWSLAVSPGSGSASAAHAGEPVALSTCCARCEKAAEYGHAGSDAYKERFSKGATRLREAEHRRQVEEAGGASPATPTTGDAGVPAPVPFSKGRNVVVDELSSSRRDLRLSERRSQAELKQRFCASAEETLGLGEMEDRAAQPSPPPSPSPSPMPTLDLVLTSMPPCLTASPLASPLLELAGPASPAEAEVDAAAIPTMRPTPKVHSSADDLLPHPSSPRPSPLQQRRKFSLGSLVFGAGVGMGEAGRAGRGF